MLNQFQVSKIMNKIEKHTIVAELVDSFNANNIVYLCDTDGLSANATNSFRKMLYENGVQMRMVKNTLLKLAMDQSDKDFAELPEVLKGIRGHSTNTSLANCRLPSFYNNKKEGPNGPSFKLNFMK